MKTLETRISFITQLENGIIRVEIKPNIELEPEDLDENFEAYVSVLGENKKGLFLIDFDKTGSASKESRERYANKKRANIKLAEALVVKSLAQKLESNFYKNFYRPTHPVEVFMDNKKAEEWLLKHKGFEASSYETSISYINKITDDFIRIEVKDKAFIDAKGLMENLEVYKKIIPPSGAYFLTIFKVNNTADKDVKTLFESMERTNLKKGEAFVVAGVGNLIELDFYTSNTKKLYPTETFTYEKDAVDWIRSLR